MPTSYRPSQAMLSLQQATRASPTLSHLNHLIETSQQMLAIVRPMLPPGLGASVHAGPVEGSNWCLLVDSTAAASKLRQLGPTLLQALASQGHTVTALRIKVQKSHWR